jgi:hypothetical protein
MRILKRPHISMNACSLRRELYSTSFDGLSLPRYQRLCRVEAAEGYRACIALPDNDMYEAVRRGDIKPLNTEVFCRRQSWS